MNYKLLPGDPNFSIDEYKRGLADIVKNSDLSDKDKKILLSDIDIICNNVRTYLKFGSVAYAIKSANKGIECVQDKCDGKEAVFN